MRVCRRFKFDAAHYLPNYEGKCKNLHGHTWFLEVEVEGPVNSLSGFVIDFTRLKVYVTDAVIVRVDHSCLNDLLDNPTCEVLIEWMWRMLDEVLPVRLVRLRLYESSDSYAEMTSYSLAIGFESFRERS